MFREKIKVLTAFHSTIESCQNKAKENDECYKLIDKLTTVYGEDIDFRNDKGNTEKSLLQ